MVALIRSPLIVDTGPLLTYLSLCFLDEIKADKARRDSALDDLRSGVRWDASKQDRCRNFFQHDKCLTTSHVLVELFRLRERTFLFERKDQFLEFALAQLEFVEERPVLLKDLDPSLVKRYGLADTGLLWIARENKGTLVTDDGKLFQGLGSDATFEIRMLDRCLDES